MRESPKEILARLEGNTLEARGFSHRDHIAVAYEAVRRDGFAGAVAVICGGLQRLTRRAGVPEKFNATLTVAFLSVIAERMASHPGDGAADFVARHPDLADPALFARWYSPERLASPLAHRVYLMPDRSDVPR